jgi:hypothetical protein
MVTQLHGLEGDGISDLLFWESELSSISPPAQSGLLDCCCVTDDDSTPPDRDKQCRKLRPPILRMYPQRDGEVDPQSINGFLAPPLFHHSRNGSGPLWLIESDTPSPDSSHDHIHSRLGEDPGFRNKWSSWAVGWCHSFWFPPLVMSSRPGYNGTHIYV